MPVGDRVVTVASAYVHTGEARTPRQEEKMRFLAAMGERLATWAAEERYAVLTGDLNIAHRVEDLKNWKGNRGKSGFLPEEQAQIDGWIGTHGFVDVHRHLHGPGPGPVHVVVVARAGVRHGCRVADRLPARVGAPRRDGGAGRGRPGGVVRGALERPRAGLGHLRPLTRHPSPNFPARSRNLHLRTTSVGVRT